MRGLAVLGAVGLTALGAAPALAAFPGSNGRIAFQSSESLGTINAAGGDRKPLVGASGVQFAAPAWSADGKRLAYVRNSGSGTAFDIFTISPEGTGVSQLTNTPGEESAPSWSPAGRIAFASDRDDANGEIYSMNADGTDVQRLTSTVAVDSAPAWSPDGARVAFSSSREGGNVDIWVMHADGGHPVRLTEDPLEETNPDWSPDGRHIVFQRDTGLAVMAANGSGERPLVADAARPAWSPDGARIAFDRQSELHAIRPDGTGSVQLTSAGTPALVASNPNWQPIPHHGHGGGPTSPSGGGTPGTDADRDGVAPPLDCDDGNAAIRPGARDIPGNKIDENCDKRDARRRVLRRTINGVTATYPSGYLEFRTLAVRPVRKGDRIRLTCKGPGCEFKRKTIRVKRNASRRSLMRFVRGMELRKGAVVQVRVTRPGTIGRAKTWTVRAPRPPRIADRCVPPGKSKTVRCRRA